MGSVFGLFMGATDTQARALDNGPQCGGTHPLLSARAGGDGGSHGDDTHVAPDCAGVSALSCAQVLARALPLFRGLSLIDTLPLSLQVLCQRVQHHGRAVLRL